MELLNFEPRGQRTVEKLTISLNYKSKLNNRIMPRLTISASTSHSCPLNNLNTCFWAVISLKWQLCLNSAYTVLDNTICKFFCSLFNNNIPTLLKFGQYDINKTIVMPKIR